jgi:P2 phage tail completion protein R (GpR).
MKKLQSFRDALLGSSAELSLDPQKTSIFADSGDVVARAGAAKGWEYRYQAIAIIQDFAGDVDAVAHAVLEWIRAEMPGLLANPEKMEKAFRFEVEMMSAELVDLQITVTVDEPVAVAGDGTFEHPAAPPLDLDTTWSWPATN